MGAKIRLEDVIERIVRIHSDVVVMDVSTFVGAHNKTRFIDKDYGEWWTSPKSVYEGRKHPKRGYAERCTPAKLSVQAVDERLCYVHMGNVALVHDTYVNLETSATFIDKDYGAWQANPHNVLRGSEHPIRAQRTRVIALNKRNSVLHWKTGEECFSQSGWERGVLLWLNKNNYDFDWQIPFETPFITKRNKLSIYYVDLYVKSGPYADKYVEIKGRTSYRSTSESLKKWNWFHASHSNSQLWQQRELRLLDIIMNNNSINSGLLQ